MKLFYKSGACSLASHIALRESGLDFTLQGVDVMKKRLENGDDYLQINPKGQFVPVNHTHRWKVERTNSWHTRGFRKLQICTEKRIRVIDAFIRLANSVIITRQLIHRAWTTHRWDTRPTQRP